MLHYAVHLSGGLTSAWALKCAIEQKGVDNVTGYFADTKGKHADNEYAGEDSDSYRLLKDLVKLLRFKLYRVADGRDIWEVMHDKRAIKIPQNDITPCSKALKADVLDRVVRQHFPHGDVVHVFGMDWSEPHRIARLTQAFAPDPVWFPLNERPYVDKDTIKQWLRDSEIAIPKLYEYGFTHNNCGGFCVRAGKAHFVRLYFTFPDRYLYHEQKELDLCTYLGKRVTILRERVNGETKTLTLRDFRERLDAAICLYPELRTLNVNGEQFQLLLKRAIKEYDPYDVGTCGCFLAGITK